MSGAKNRLEFLRYIRHGKLNRKKLVILLMVLLIGTIAYMSIGASLTQNYGTTEAEVDMQEYPGEFELPNQDGNGFNLTQDFSNLPDFEPPTEFYDTDLFDPAEWGDGFNISNPGFTGEFPDLTFPSGGFPTITLPTYTPPTFNPGSGITNPSFPDQSGIATPSIDQNASKGGMDFQIPNRENKARNLPRIDWFDNMSISINLPGMPSIDLDIEITIEGLVFVLLLISLLYVNKKFLPELMYKLEHGDDDEMENKTSEFFIKAPKPDEEESRRKARLEKLVVFKDHLDEIVVKSYIRMDENGPSDTIILGYHDLDEAFASFTKLLRTKDITPLEHARHQFETGEIDNKRLKEIVNLFYITRFGKREMIVNDGMEFIDHLVNLVIQDQLKEIDNDKI